MSRDISPGRDTVGGVGESGEVLVERRRPLRDEGELQHAADRRDDGDVPLVAVAGREDRTRAGKSVSATGMSSTDWWFITATIGSSGSDPADRDAHPGRETGEP